MEKFELKKKLEKKKAYCFCIMLFLTLLTPTLIGLCAALNLSRHFQIGVVCGIFVSIAWVYKKMNRVRNELKLLFR